MNIFKNKTNTYKIDCYLDKTNQVRGLAERHAIAGSVVEVRAHSSLFNNSNNVRVTLTFKSKDSEPVIYKAFLEAFRNYRIKINKKSISIYREDGLI